jgi:hypothetical protein
VIVGTRRDLRRSTRVRRRRQGTRVHVARVEGGNTVVSNLKAGKINGRVTLELR